MSRRITVITVMLVLCSIPAGTTVMGQSKEDGIKLYEQGQELLQKAKSDEEFKEAIEKQEQALRIFEKIKFDRGIGVVADNLGMIYYRMRKYAKAAPYYEKSLAISRKLKEIKIEENVLYVLGDIYEALGQYPEALDYFQKALEISSMLADVRGKGKHLNRIGCIQWQLSQYAKAKDSFEKSLKIAKDLNDGNEERENLVGLGSAYLAWGLYAKSIEYYEQALEICGKLRDGKGEGRILTNLGIVHMESGQYAKALEYYRRAMETFRNREDVAGEALALNELGLFYRAWGQYSKAVEHLDKSLKINRRLTNTKNEGQNLNNLALLYTEWGQHTRATEYFKQSLAIARNLEDQQGEALVLTNLGKVYAAMGQYENALKSLQIALTTYSRIGVPVAWTKVAIGDLCLDMGDVGKAEPFLREAGDRASLGRLHLFKSDYRTARGLYEDFLQAAKKNRGAASLFVAFTGLGIACEGLGDNQGAAENFRQAIEIAEEVRAGLNPGDRGEFYNVRVGGFYRTAPYEGLARVMIKLNKPLDALKESEYTKARIFAEGLSKRAEGSAPPLPADVLERDFQLNDQTAALIKNLQKAYEKEDREAIASLEPQVKKAKEKLAAHVNWLRKEYQLFAATKYPQPIGLGQASLEQNEWVLAYHVTDSGIIAYLTQGRNLVRGVFKPIARTELDDLVRKFRDPMEVGPEDQQACAKQGLKPSVCLMRKICTFDFASGKMLADILLGDILADLPKDAPVIVVPDGSLGVAPFEMLVLNDGGKIVVEKGIPRTLGAEFFGDRNPTSYSQSITALTLARTLGKQGRPGDRLLVVADPVFKIDDTDRQAPATGTMAVAEGEQRYHLETMIAMEEAGHGLRFGRLKYTGPLAEQLEAIFTKDKTDCYTGLSATKKALLTTIAPTMNQYRSVVFATHGYFNKDNPIVREPILALTCVPPGTDGLLRMSEVMGLKMNADIVALTACQTGLGRVISGEGTMGMGRAFQYAGAKSVLMTLWSVAEKSSVQMVESFFRHVNEGKTKLEALRLARKEIRGQGYDHPFFWAPFILVGEVE